MTAEEHKAYRRQIVRESQRRRRAEAKKTGMCSMCCTKPARKGFKTCEDCAERSRISMKEHMDKLKEDGVCVICRISPAETGYKTCRRCRILQSLARKMMREHH